MRPLATVGMLLFMNGAAEAATYHVDCTFTKGASPTLTIEAGSAPGQPCYYLQPSDKMAAGMALKIDGTRETPLKITSKEALADGDGFVVRLQRDGKPIAYVFGAKAGGKSWKVQLPALQTLKKSAVRFADGTPNGVVFVYASSGGNGVTVDGDLAGGRTVAGSHSGMTVFQVHKRLPSTGTVLFHALGSAAPIDGYQNRLIVGGVGGPPAPDVELPDVGEGARLVVRVKGATSQVFRDSFETDPKLAAAVSASALELVKKLAKKYAPLSERKPTNAELKSLTAAARATWTEASHNEGPVLGGNSMLVGLYMEWLTDAAQIRASRPVVIKRESDHLVLFVPKDQGSAASIATAFAFSTFSVKVTKKNGGHVAESPF